MSYNHANIRQEEYRQIQYTSTYSIHLHTVYIYIQYTSTYSIHLSTYSIHLHTVYIYIQYTSTYSIHLHTVYIYIQVILTINRSSYNFQKGKYVWKTAVGLLKSIKQILIRCMSVNVRCRSNDFLNIKEDKYHFLINLCKLYYVCIKDLHSNNNIQCLFSSMV